MNPAPSAPLFDAHNHLHDAWLAPHRDRVLADLAAAGVRAVIVNGTSESDWPDVASLCRPPLSPLAPRLLPSLGLHPWDAGNRTTDWQRALLSHLDSQHSHSSHPSSSFHPPFIGEIGLDRWILDRARPDDPRLAGLRRAPLDEQIEVFRWQLALAAERNLPASIHCLDAFGALHDVLRSTPRPARGFLLHAYSGPAEMVSAFAKLGAYFSFNGAFLDPRKQRLQSVYATAIPADRLLVETDAPAMRPPPAHEKFPPLPADDGSLAHHPANLAASYAALAELRGTFPDALAAQIAANFTRLFGPLS
ncbi:MAG TPA: TatD family hydrolase [Opitutus sp.]|nr:TatD family hydrolase [Opitutus sp.]